MNRRPVAQVADLPYRRLQSLRARDRSADWQSAIRQTGSLRYGAGRK